VWRIAARGRSGERRRIAPLPSTLSEHDDQPGSRSDAAEEEGDDVDETNAVAHRQRSDQRECE
jgi:hypothetical protein